MIRISVAMTAGGVIGDKGRIPWRMPSDMVRFRANTMGRALIVGRKTWDGIQAQRDGRGLEGRTVFVLTREDHGDAARSWLYGERHGAPFGTASAASPADLGNLVNAFCGGDAWAIGGAEIYALALPVADEIHLTTVFGQVAGDTVWTPPHVLRNHSGFEVVHETTAARVMAEDEAVSMYTILRRIKHAA